MSNELTPEEMFKQLGQIVQILETRQFANHESNTMKDALCCAIRTMAGQKLHQMSIGGAIVGVQPSPQGQGMVIGNQYHQGGEEISPGCVVFDPNKTGQSQPAGSMIHGHALIDVSAAMAHSPSNPGGAVAAPGSLMAAAQSGGDIGPAPEQVIPGSLPALPTVPVAGQMVPVAGQHIDQSGHVEQVLPQSHAVGLQLANGIPTPGQTVVEIIDPGPTPVAAPATVAQVANPAIPPQTVQVAPAPVAPAPAAAAPVRTPLIQPTGGNNHA